MNKIKTIDVNAREWFDRVNGNSYFSAVIVLDYGRPTEQVITLPFQYGYDSHYIHVAADKLRELGFIAKDDRAPLWRYCAENNIILRTSKITGCRKRELIHG